MLKRISASDPLGLAPTSTWPCFLVFAIATGVNIPVWLDLLGKLVPVRLRGRCMAYRQLGGLALGVSFGAMAAFACQSQRFAFSEMYTAQFTADNAIAGIDSEVGRGKNMLDISGDPLIF